MKKMIAYLLPFLVIMLPLVAGAEGLTNPLGNTTLTQFLRRLLQLVAEIGFPFIVLFLIIIGFRFVAAEGNSEKLGKLRGLFFWALIGALIVLGAEALSLAIEGTVEQLKTDI